MLKEIWKIQKKPIITKTIFFMGIFILISVTHLSHNFLNPQLLEFIYTSTSGEYQENNINSQQKLEQSINGFRFDLETTNLSVIFKMPSIIKEETIKSNKFCPNNLSLCSYQYINLTSTKSGILLGLVPEEYQIWVSILNITDLIGGNNQPFIFLGRNVNFINQSFSETFSMFFENNTNSSLYLPIQYTNNQNDFTTNLTINYFCSSENLEESNNTLYRALNHSPYSYSLISSYNLDFIVISDIQSLHYFYEDSIEKSTGIPVKSINSEAVIKYKIHCNAFFKYGDYLEIIWFNGDLNNEYKFFESLLYKEISQLDNDARLTLDFDRIQNDYLQKKDLRIIFNSLVLSIRLIIQIFAIFIIVKYYRLDNVVYLSDNKKLSKIFGNNIGYKLIDNSKKIIIIGVSLISGIAFSYGFLKIYSQNWILKTFWVNSYQFLISIGIIIFLAELYQVFLSKRCYDFEQDLKFKIRDLNFLEKFSLILGIIASLGIIFYNKEFLIIAIIIGFSIIAFIITKLWIKFINLIIKFIEKRYSSWLYKNDHFSKQLPIIIRIWKKSTNRKMLIYIVLTFIIISILAFNNYISNYENQRFLIGRGSHIYIDNVNNIEPSLVNEIYQIDEIQDKTNCTDVYYDITGDKNQSDSIEILGIEMKDFLSYYNTYGYKLEDFINEGDISQFKDDSVVLSLAFKENLGYRINNTIEISYFNNTLGNKISKSFIIVAFYDSWPILHDNFEKNIQSLLLYRMIMDITQLEKILESSNSSINRRLLINVAKNDFDQFKNNLSTSLQNLIVINTLYYENYIESLGQEFLKVLIPIISIVGTLVLLINLNFKGVNESQDKKELGLFGYLSDHRRILISFLLYEILLILVSLFISLFICYLLIIQIFKLLQSTNFAINIENMIDIVKVLGITFLPLIFFQLIDYVQRKDLNLPKLYRHPE